jgi:8-hydroxy-5-deazaflavin:NADPH oxidoreductase
VTAETAKPLTIAVLGGTGQEGGGLALRLAKAGHRVILGSRSPDRAAQRAAEMNARLGETRVSGAGNKAATEVAELVLLTVPYAAQRTTVEEVREGLVGKILIDATAPLVPPKVARVQLPEGGSATAAIQALLGDAVRVVSAFQNISASHLDDLDHEIDCEVLVCGDDPAARGTVIALAADIGLTAWHAGPIANSAAAEALTSVMIFLNRHYKSPGSGIRVTGVQRAKTTDK